MPGTSRFYVRSPDGRGIAGYDRRETAEYVAMEYGKGTHVVDTDMHEPWGGKKRIDTIGPTIPLGCAGVPDDVGAAVRYRKC